MLGGKTHSSEIFCKCLISNLGLTKSRYYRIPSSCLKIYGGQRRHCTSKLMPNKDQLIRVFFAYICGYLSVFPICSGGVLLSYLGYTA